jgi:hypothetical protein
MNGIEDEDDPLESVEEALARKMQYTAQLKDAILRLHGCESEYAGREDVIETFQGETVWSGYVEIFRLIDHPKAKKCYAWSHLTGEDHTERRFVAVLELPPVDSPEMAVRAAVAAEIKDAREKAKGR